MMRYYYQYDLKYVDGVVRIGNYEYYGDQNKLLKYVTFNNGVHSFKWYFGNYGSLTNKNATTYCNDFGITFDGVDFDGACLEYKQFLLSPHRNRLEFQLKRLNQLFKTHEKHEIEKSKAKEYLENSNEDRMQRINQHNTHINTNNTN